MYINNAMQGSRGQCKVIPRYISFRMCLLFVLTELPEHCNIPAHVNNPRNTLHGVVVFRNVCYVVEIY